MRRYARLTLLLFMVAASCLPIQAQDAPIKVALISGSEEYNSDHCFALLQEHLEAHYPMHCVLLRAIGFDDLPGLRAVEDCDVVVLYTRRLTLPPEQLETVQAIMASPKPLIAIRTASHGFQDWLEFDAEYLGGNYDGHYGSQFSQRAEVVEDNAGHPILAGIDDFVSPYSLYRTAPLAEDCTVLMTSSIPNQDPEPAVWTRVVDGKKIFYSSIGGASDFESANYLRLLSQAIYWGIGQEAPPVAIPEAKPAPETSKTLTLPLRTRVQAFKSQDDWRALQFFDTLPVNETAILVCDMWDRHWCQGATDRVNQIAERMAPVLEKAQQSGMLVVHAPSETMPFYAYHPQRMRALAAPETTFPEEREIEEPPLPIDDSDGGCDTGQTVPYRAWSRQHPALPIGPHDIISDNGREIFRVFQQAGIKNILVMGVHTNMCVLNRSFAIRQMTRWGKNCILVRDLTDAMYDPNDYPYVSHERGTELVIEHIEKYWGPSIESADLMRALQ